jgi:hypothetical protein
MLEFTARLGFRARLDAADPSVVRVERTLA